MQICGSKVLNLVVLLKEKILFSCENLFSDPPCIEMQGGVLHRQALAAVAAASAIKGKITHPSDL